VLAAGTSRYTVSPPLPVTLDGSDASDASDDERAPPTPEHDPRYLEDHPELRRRPAMPIAEPTIDASDVIAALAHPTITMPAPAPPSPATVARQRQQAAADALAVIANEPLPRTIHAGIRTYWTASRGDPADADRVNAVPTPTPRSLRYSKRFAHLQLALLMCCVGEVQSSAVALGNAILHRTVLSP
jgi:hypothetical protein